MTELRFKRFPPGRGNIGVSTRSGRAAAAAIALYGPCRPAVVATQHLVWLAARIGGAAVLPGAPRPWRPLPEELWRRLRDEWESVVGPFDDLAVYERSQASRTGFGALLLRLGQPIAFVKVRSGDSEALMRERDALSGVATAGLGDVRVPRLLGSGSLDDLTWLAVSPLPPRPHRPPPRTLSVRAVAARIQEALRDWRPEPVPSHWRPMHGDLTPWNLRCLDRDLWLIDWEDVGWAPPEADAVYYAATNAASRGVAVSTGWPEESVRFWEERVAARDPADADAAFATALRSVLATMRGAAPPR